MDIETNLGLFLQEESLIILDDIKDLYSKNTNFFFDEDGKIKELIEKLEESIKKDYSYNPIKDMLKIRDIMMSKGFDFGELYEIYGGLEPGKEKLSSKTNSLINEVKRKSGDILNKN